jgi:tRNA U34 5-carboxymethylaminomethyl modifying enzyme MnmG/GidA
VSGGAKPVVPRRATTPATPRDVIVVGGGVAGSEAAMVAARGGADVLLVTTSLDTVYATVGDAVRLDPPAGSLMAEVVPGLQDEGGRVGNWALHRAVKYALEAEPRLHLLQSTVSALMLDDQGAVRGVSTWEGVERLAPRVALCAGSFLHGRLTIGELTESAGRLSEMAYDELYLDLVARGARFRDVELRADPAGGALPYVVRCRAFAPSQRDPASFALTRFPGVFAAGVCASGYLPFEAAAEEGLRLGRALLETG